MQTSFVKVAKASDIPMGGMKMVTLGIEEVLIANVEGKLYAIGNACTHVGGPLVEGELSGKVVTCPWHGSQFDVTTGQVVGPPARLPEPVYELSVQGDDVMIRKKS